MKILLSNHQLGSFAGSEIFTYTLACSLKSKGHEVQVYSAYLGKISQLFLQKGIPVVDELKYLPDDFDIAHVHHNINAYEIRNKFPNLPMVFVSHGVFPQSEQPPLINLCISKYLAVSEEVQKNLNRYGIENEEITIFRNLIDETKFYPKNKINDQPKKALIISNKIDTVTEITIRRACTKLGIDTRFIGQRFEYVPNESLPEIINQCDIVFTLSRGVAESMLCGRVPIVIDSGVGDGLVTPDNFSYLVRDFFCGTLKRKIFTVDELVQEIKKYRQDYGEQLRQIALEEFSASRQTEKLMSIYEDCLASKEKPSMSQQDKAVLAQFYEMIKLTRRRSSEAPQDLTKNFLVYELGGPRAYKLFRLLGKLRYCLVPPSSRREKLFVKLFRSG